MVDDRRCGRQCVAKPGELGWLTVPLYRRTDPLTRQRPIVPGTALCLEDPTKAFGHMSSEDTARNSCERLTRPQMDDHTYLGSISTQVEHEPRSGPAVSQYISTSPLRDAIVKRCGLDGRRHKGFSSKPRLPPRGSDRFSACHHEGFAAQALLLSPATTSA